MLPHYENVSHTEKRQEGKFVEKDFIALYQEDINHLPRGRLKTLAEFNQHLEPQDLIDYAFSILRQKHKVCYFYFSSSEIKYQYKNGKKENFCKSYTLKFNQQILGTIVISTVKEMVNPKKIKHILECLILPLRNAIIYENSKRTALIDPLTGTSNRVAFTKLFHSSEIKPENLNNLSVLVIDVDRFKNINDSYGHMAGDVLLRTVSQLIIKNVRKSDHVYRIGGEEFFVTLVNTKPSEADTFAERIRLAIEDMDCQFNKQIMNITVSIGISYFLKNDTLGSLFQRADKALYTAKGKGGNLVEFF